ncbi:hypothetical protein EYV94_17815 [Puteibacter caeruleilacunae]|nr:hypothetical protein EYV94_17815 [Puteibacter caeruleilacunae]
MKRRDVLMILVVLFASTALFIKPNNPTQNQFNKNQLVMEPQINDSVTKLDHSPIYKTQLTTLLTVEHASIPLGI